MGIFGWSYPAGCHGTPYDEEGPENCVCGKPNADEETGEWLCLEAPGYCSVPCRDADLAEQREQAKAEAAMDKEMDSIFASMVQP